MGDADEAGGMFVENLDDLREIGEAAGQSVDFVDDNDVDFAGLHVREQTTRLTRADDPTNTPFDHE